MFDNIFEAIEEWMRELLSGMIRSNLSTMFTGVNQKTGAGGTDSAGLEWQHFQPDPEPV